MSLMLNPANSEPYYAALGRLACSFASLEYMTKSLLARVASGDKQRPDSFRTEMAIADFSFFNAIQKLQLIANELESEPWKGYLLHAMECVDRLRIYRNYYLHGLVHVAEHDGQIMGMIDVIDTRNGFREVNEYVDIEKLETIEGHLEKIQSFILMIEVFRMWGDIPNWQKELDEARPALPDELRKPHRFVIPHFHEVEAKRRELMERFKKIGSAAEL